MSAWHAAYGDNVVSVAALLSKLTGCFDIEPYRALREAVAGFFGREVKDINAKALGKALGYRKDRIVHGLRLEHGPKQNDKQTWRVRRVSDSQPAFTGM